MSKVGRFIADPSGGGLYCHITLTSGEKILVNHDKKSLDSGHLAIEVSKWLGLGSDGVFSLDLDSADGPAALRRLTAGAEAGSMQATPIGALVEYIEDSRNVDEVRQRCDRLLAAARAAA